MVEVTDLGVVAEITLAFLKFHDAREDFQQGGFTRPVRADQHGAFAAFDGEVEAGVNPVRAVGHVDPFERNGALSPARRRRNLEAERLARRERFLNEFEPLNLLELALGLRRF